MAALEQQTYQDETRNLYIISDMFPGWLYLKGRVNRTTSMDNRYLDLSLCSQENPRSCSSFYLYYEYPILVGYSDLCYVTSDTNLSTRF